MHKKNYLHIPTQRTTTELWMYGKVWLYKVGLDVDCFHFNSTRPLKMTAQAKNF